MFEEISLKVDDYRDGVQRKLNELNMALQRPKIPTNSPAPGIMLPGRLLDDSKKDTKSEI